ncbi:nicotinate-nucleotide-dimethylbenzimidazole phosphoribosyltransferase isoform B [Micractinium conductrix]|uniref:Nicotinate-nucleotide--dimethylbenzimidazole phosphoribosyltransferase n=1 Tax=Micractinium conductrix TaxID=554055 RepID=A0A2P6VK94_9CHLO|nr:nicotinate-nucleotide-dimethylbenzimidazole phosphoribosyltransferase isoform B [Micractinium conductrix]|eukprot:PSC74487.1 nicotinate-nucleotide-dimethylbenzimidazole phosphoribosyltransferase isoform B [Micractinium conductrix]
MSPPDGDFQHWLVRAQEAVDGKAKPKGSLGLLEEWAVRLCALQRTLRPRLDVARLVVFAADHGVTAEGQAPGVSAYPRALTASVFGAVAAGHSACAALCAANGVSLELIDVGVDADVAGVAAAPGIGLVHAKIRRGTSSMLAGPALAPAELEAALEAGAAAVARAAAGVASPPLCVLCVGELGIGNTTAAAAVLAALTGAPPEEVCGRGTGLDDAGLRLKCATVAAALAANAAVLEGRDPLAALAAVGGLEVAAMAGAYLAAGRLGMPCLVDGFISGVAAAAAARANPNAAAVQFWSHASAERGAAAAAAAAGGSARPVLTMGLRLGEGTGAVLAVPLLRSAAAVMRDMASLQEVLAAAGAGGGAAAPPDGGGAGPAAQACNGTAAQPDGGDPPPPDDSCRPVLWSL